MSLKNDDVPTKRPRITREEDEDARMKDQARVLRIEELQRRHALKEKEKEADRIMAGLEARNVPGETPMAPPFTMKSGGVLPDIYFPALPANIPKRKRPAYAPTLYKLDGTRMEWDHPDYAKPAEFLGKDYPEELIDDRNTAKLKEKRESDKGPVLYHIGPKEWHSSQPTPDLSTLDPVDIRYTKHKDYYAYEDAQRKEAFNKKTRERENPTSAHTSFTVPSGRPSRSSSSSSSSSSMPATYANVGPPRSSLPPSSSAPSVSDQYVSYPPRLPVESSSAPSMATFREERPRQQEGAPRVSATTLISRANMYSKTARGYLDGTFHRVVKNRTHEGALSEDQYIGLTHIEFKDNIDITRRVEGESTSAIIVGVQIGYASLKMDDVQFTALSLNKEYTTIRMKSSNLPFYEAMLSFTASLVRRLMENGAPWVNPDGEIYLPFSESLETNAAMAEFGPLEEYDQHKVRMRKTHMWKIELQGQKAIRIQVFQDDTGEDIDGRDCETSMRCEFKIKDWQRWAGFHG